MARGYAPILLLLGLLNILAQANNLPRDDDLLPYQTIRDGAPSPKTNAAATVLDILRRGYSCPAGSLPCLDGVGCCRFSCCGSGCCLAGEFCYDEKAPAVCCRAYTEKRCTSGCIPFDATCCGNGKFCEWGTKCVPGGCCKWGRTCTGNAGPPTQYTRSRATDAYTDDIPPPPPPPPQTDPPPEPTYSDPPAIPTTDREIDTDTNIITDDYTRPPVAFTTDSDSSPEVFPTPTETFSSADIVTSTSSSSVMTSSLELPSPTYDDPTARPTPSSQDAGSDGLNMASLHGVAMGWVVAAAVLVAGVLGVL